MNKCQKYELAHAWKDITPNEIYLTYPPQFPPKTEKCLNCGLVRKLIVKHSEEWVYTPTKEENEEGAVER